MGSLAGKRIVVTRATAQADSFIVALRGAGATPIAFPCIEIVPPEQCAELALAMRELSTDLFDWLILTSQNAVQSIERSVQMPVRLKVGVVGPETGAAFADWFVREPDFVGLAGTGVELALNLPISAGDSVLIPQSAIANLDMGEILRSRGAVVTEVIAYETRVPCISTNSEGNLADVDAITFASGSAVRGFLELTAGSQIAFLDVPVVCIGSSSAEVARLAGFLHIKTASRASVAGLVEILTSMFINHHVLQETT